MAVGWWRCRALLGQQIIEFFNISVASLQVGGGLIMIMMAMNMPQRPDQPHQGHAEEEDEAEAKASVAVVPAGTAAADRAGLDQHG
ncbi:MarC family protein [Cupriavidus sp. USMAHM13]|uniref:MarC family protein n=1 Tax=Cupriavidus sp. USMAHM13 TaxID=1389192 RepID=UPI000A9D2A7B